MADPESEEETYHGIGVGPNKKAKMNNGSSAPSSFAARMMAKMGYREGEGLGATGRGRLAPIETQTRPQGAGLGAVKEKTKQAKEEEKREAAFRGEVLEDSSEEERKRRKKEKQKKALGGASGARAKPRVKYKTAATIEAESEGLQVPNVLKNLIDLNGKGTTLLAGNGNGPSALSTFMVSGETEAEKLAKRARRDLEALAEEWATVQERKKYLELESAQLIGEIDAHQEELNRVRDIVSMVHQLQELSIDKAMDHANQWEAVTKKLETMEIDFQNHVSQLGLQEVAVAAIYPLCRQAMAEWKPLDDPAFLVPFFSRLQHVLGINGVEEEQSLALRNGHHSIKRSRKATTSYETLIYTLWLPPVRTAITNTWNVHDSAPLITLLEAWRPLLPDYILGNVIDQLIVQRLQSVLSEWEPHRSQKKHKNTTPTPDVWLLPWFDFPYLSAHHLSASSPDSLLSALKRKYRSVLARLSLTQPPPAWLMALTSRLDGLAPPLLIRHLLGRLNDHLATHLTIDPSDQDLVPLTNVLAFAPLFSASTTAELLTTALFPKWHATLHLWLTSPHKNYTEIAQWYQWWKTQIPAAVTALPAIEAEWTKALAMMDTAMALGDRAATDLPPPESSIATTIGNPITASTSAANMPTLPLHDAASQVPKPALPPETTFRDVVEEWCQEEGLLMMPLREAHATTGAPLWRITASANGRGGALVYVKGDVLWARSLRDREVWEPVALDAALVKRAGG